jgi:diguanylate cyclase (GGDEF)-like protein
MFRNKTIPAIVIVLSLAAIFAIAVLEERAGAGRDAQLKLATLKSDLTELQNAPFTANPRTGGSPESARQLMQDGKRRVAGTLAALRRSSPVPALARIPSPLRTNYAALDEIYAIGAAGDDYGAYADHLAGVAAQTMDGIEDALNEATGEYDRRASASDFRAKVGSAVTIFLLALAFVFLYRRVGRARAVAESLARENARLAATSHEEARTDSLTGLPNRRALVDDLDAELARAGGKRPVMIALFDLDGFKQYNDTFGHPAGDALLARLGERLGAAVEGIGTAYRMGGDEFCVLAPLRGGDTLELLERGARALGEEGDGFEISAAHGCVLVPEEADDAGTALGIADRRMYADKAGARRSADEQSRDVLLKALEEHHPDLGDHVHDVGQLAEVVGLELGLEGQSLHHVRQAAELHDIGKVAVPRTILDKPGRLTDEEWAFIARHTLIGERILGAALALRPVARIVRASHEHFDGNGYPDGLRGHEIPLGARIVAVCDAYDAMTSDRPYQARLTHEAALAELRRCAGGQFDPDVVDAFCRAQAERPAPGLATS